VSRRGFFCCLFSGYRRRLCVLVYTKMEDLVEDNCLFFIC
jgi:hypothetical protein